MTLCPRFFSRLLAALVLVAGSASAGAIPKAAEHEDAPVVIGPDVAKPKASAKPVKKEVRKKAPPTAKAKAKQRKPAAATKKTRTAAGRK